MGIQPVDHFFVQDKPPAQSHFPKPSFPKPLLRKLAREVEKPFYAIDMEKLIYIQQLRKKRTQKLEIFETTVSEN